MLPRLFLIFVIVPLADLALLLFLAKHLGWKISLAVVFITGMLGAWLVRRAYRSLLERVQNGRELPLNLLSEAALVLLGGALLLAPGYLTDLVGISLLVPWSRRRIHALLSKWFAAKFQVKLRDNSFFACGAEWEQIVEGTKVNPPASQQKTES